MRPVFILISAITLLSGFLFFRPEEVRLRGTKVYSLTSEHTGERYRIWVSLPDGYKRETAYPAIYLLDADICFAAASSIVRQMELGGEIPPVILIGVAYDTDDSLLTAKRRLDFTPTACGGFDGPTGGADAFRRFISGELIPWSEDHFALVPEQRAIAGYSYSALFVLHSMFMEPGLFRSRLAVSPSLWWDGKIMFEAEQLFAEGRTSLPGKLFVSVGENETEYNTTYPMAKDVTKFCGAFKSRRYAGLSFSAALLPEESHRSSFPIAFTKGVRFLFTNSVK
jgi:predicted alpha/beta superfamily hydrolase